MDSMKIEIIEKFFKKRDLIINQLIFQEKINSYSDRMVRQRKMYQSLTKQI